MNGPEHYKEAERLLDEVRGNNQNPMITYAEDAAGLAAAQVHATLALAAAQVDTAPDPDEHGHRAEWNEATR